MRMFRCRNVVVRVGIVVNAGDPGVMHSLCSHSLIVHSPSEQTPSSALRSTVYDLIDDTAVEATHLVFASLGEPSAHRVSFEQFGQWYNADGFLVLPWLELLDLRKWPFSGNYSRLQRMQFVALADRA